MAVERAEIVLPARGRFDLRVLVCAQAARLPTPFQWHDDPQPVLERAEQLPDGSVHGLRIRPASHGVVLQVTGRDAREIEVLAPLAARVRRALCLDVDLADFRRTCSRDPLLVAAPRSGLRMVRGTSAFEDAVGVLTWSGASADHEPPIARLARLGRRCPARPALRAFPGPALLATTPLGQLRTATGLGHRAAYVSALARDVTRGRCDLEAIARLPVHEATRALRGVRGLGPLGIARLLLLLGHHDVPVLDRAARAFARRTLGGDGPPFARWLRRQRPWRGLALWCALDSAETAAAAATGLRNRRSGGRSGRAGRS